MTGWPADRVERRALRDLVLAARNARQHSESQVAQIAASIEQWGWTVPILIDENNQLIAGHGRLLAAEKLGITDVPAMVAEGWTEEQKRAYLVADNRLSEIATWDYEVLQQELKQLGEQGFDLSLMGFQEDELAHILAARAIGNTDPDDIPPLPETPVTKVGDLYMLGRHRLVCGDCTDAARVARALGQARPQLMVTDPPYGVEYDPDWRNDRLMEAHRAIGEVVNDDCADWRAAWQHYAGDVAYVWSASLRAVESGASLRAAGFQLRTMIIWVKTSIVVGRGDYHWQHEPCWYAVRKGRTGHWNGSRTESTVWEIAKPQASETGHSTQKPVECMRRPIENNSKPGEPVYDPFVGSGTTIIACEQTGRAAITIEIMPAYCDVAIQRWQDFTGEKARREDGTPFDQLKAAA